MIVSRANDVTQKCVVRKEREKEEEIDDTVRFYFREE